MTTTLADIVSLAKRRGFVYPSSEIYGGFSATYDYGPLGAQLGKQLKDLWWKFFITNRDDMIPMDGAIFCHPKTWEASGHVDAFHDPLVEDKVTHQRFRADKIIEDKLDMDTTGMQFDEMDRIIKENKLKSPDGNDLTEVKRFNLLVEARLGSTEETKTTAYMRGETCQLIFLQYKNIIDSMRVKVPFGVGQIGKSFRNEITTKQFILRTREFTQMETEYFVHPDKGEHFFEEWKKLLRTFLIDIAGLDAKRLRFRTIEGDEKSHYAVMQNDIEYQIASGEWIELTPLNHRGDWDLSRHSKFSRKDLTYRDPHTGEKYIPHAIETSIGFDRLFYCLLEDAYWRDEDNNRTVLKLSPQLAPYSVAVFPLVKNKPELVSKARELYDTLSPNYRTIWDDRGNIGKRYYYQDEMGTPLCVTVDHQTLEDDMVTVRDRDTTEQERISIDKLNDYLTGRLTRSDLTGLKA